MASPVGSLIVRIGADLGGFERALTQATRRANRLAGQFGKVGQTLTRNVTVPLVGMGTAAVIASERTANAMRAIRIGTGATGDDLTALEGVARRIAGTVPQGIDAIAEAVTDLSTRTGLTGQDLEKLSRQVLDLSRITREDLSNVVRTSTRLFGDWGESVENQAARLDTLFRVSQRTGASVTQLAKQVTDFGSSFRLLGIGLDEAVGTLGEWEREGVNTERILSGLGQGVRNLGRIAAEEGIEMRDAFIAVREELKGLSDAQALTRGIEIFGARAAPDMVAAIREGRLEFEKFGAEAATTGDSISQVAEDALTLADRLKMLGERASLAAAPLGEVLVSSLDRLMPALDRLGGFVERASLAFARLEPSTQQAVVVIAALVAAVGPAAKVGAIFLRTYAALLPVLKVVVVAAKALAVALAGLSLPVAVVIAAVAALTFALVKWRTEIAGAVMGAVGRVRDGLGTIAGAFQRLMELAAPFTSFAVSVGRLLREIAGLFHDLGFVVGRASAEVISAVRSVLLDGLRRAASAVAGVVGRLAAPFAPAAAEIIRILSQLVRRVGEILVGGIVRHIDRLREQVDRATGFFRDLRDRVVGNSYVPDLIDGIEREFARLDEVMVKPTLEAVNTITRAFASIESPEIRPVVAVQARGPAAAVGADGGALAGVFSQLAVAGQGLLASLGPLALLFEVVRGALDALRPALEAIMEPIRMVGEIIGTLIAPYLELLAPVLRAVAIAASFLAEIIARVAQAIATAVGSFVRAIGRLLRLIPGLGGLGRALQRAGQSMLNFADRMGQVATDMQDARRRIRGLGESGDEAAGALASLTREIQNAPRVLRLDALRFQATGAAPGPAAVTVSEEHNYDITIIGSEKTAGELLDELEREASFRRARGGGGRFSLATV